MARKLNDDEINEYAFSRLFGDLDGIRSGGMFGGDQGAEAGSGAGMAGVSVEIKPIMEGSAEPHEGTETPEEKEDEDRLRGIGDMSPLMAQLHGSR